MLGGDGATPLPSSPAAGRDLRAPSPVAGRVRVGVRGPHPRPAPHPVRAGVRIASGPKTHGADTPGVATEPIDRETRPMRCPQRARPSRRGFTMVELLVVILIIAILMALLVPAIAAAVAAANNARVAAEQQNLQTA